MNTRIVRSPWNSVIGIREGHWLQPGYVALVALAVAVIAGPLARLPTASIVQTSFSLELSGTSDGALGILRAYADAGKIDAAFAAINWDFLLILSYSIGLPAYLEWLTRLNEGRATNSGSQVSADTLMLFAYAAWGAVLGGVCDVMENASMIYLLWVYGHCSKPQLGVAAFLGTSASLMKWTLLCSVLGFTVWETGKCILRTNYDQPQAR